MQKWPKESGQIVYLVPKDAQCSEIYTKTIFQFFSIFLFNKSLIFDTDFLRKKISYAHILLATKSKYVKKILRKWKKKFGQKNYWQNLFDKLVFRKFFFLRII